MAEKENLGLLPRAPPMAQRWRSHALTGSVGPSMKNGWTSRLQTPLGKGWRMQLRRRVGLLRAPRNDRQLVQSQSDSMQHEWCDGGDAQSRSGEPLYYLVVPLGATREGSYGTGSDGVERPRSTATCRLGSDPLRVPEVPRRLHSVSTTGVDSRRTTRPPEDKSTCVRRGDSRRYLRKSCAITKLR